MPSNMSNDALDAVSLKLGGAHAVLDTLYTLANTGSVEELDAPSLGSLLDVAMNLISDAKDALDGRTPAVAAGGAA